MSEEQRKSNGAAEQKQGQPSEEATQGQSLADKAGELAGEAKRRLDESGVTDKAREAGDKAKQAWKDSGAEEPQPKLQRKGAPSLRREGLYP